MSKVLGVCLTLILGGCAARVAPVEPPAPEVADPRLLDARVDVATFDRELLARAIFQETNRVRAQLGLKPFKYRPKLNEAADLEAAVGKFYQSLSHTNPFPMIGTPGERVRHVGLEASLVAENIALLSIYEISPYLGAGVTVRNGRKHFVNPETQEELRPATYRHLAATVVDAWMNSPGHRANIVHQGLNSLACSVQPSVSVLGVDQLFCVQVFFTPKVREGVPVVAEPPSYFFK